jgi:tetrahydromethanopterin S-methyltransferase subunit C
MKLKPKITIADYFTEIEDPRVERTRQHKLIDIISIAICAVICGAEGWTDIETYGLTKYEWLKQFLELPNGILSALFAVFLKRRRVAHSSRYICPLIRPVKSSTVSAVFFELD